VTTAGLVTITTVETQSTTQLVAIVVVLIAEFSIATVSCLALERTRSSSSPMEAGSYLRAIAATALVISVAAILFVSWFTWILGTNSRVQL
jgi:uncharacterized membrane protein YidH (DUF202 family)